MGDASPSLSPGRAGSLAPLLAAFLAGCGPADPGPILPKPKALLEEARELSRQGEIDEAVRRLEAHLHDFPRTLGVNFTLGTILLDASRAEEAVDHFRRELELKPDHTASLEQLGGAYERLGRFELVVECFDTQATLDPDDWRPCYRAGVVLRKYLDRLEEAESRLIEARRRQPQGTESRIELGRVYVDLGREADAEALFREILADRPDEPEAYLHLGQILFRRGDSTEGEALLARFRVLAGERDRLGQLEVAGTATSQCAAGALHREKGQLRKALSAYNQAIELDPGNLCGHLGAARVLRDLGKHGQALSRLARARELAPNDFGVHFETALALAGMGRGPEAAAALSAAHAVRPPSREEAREASAAFAAAGIAVEASGDGR